MVYAIKYSALADCPLLTARCLLKATNSELQKLNSTNVKEK
jgi:hypothetical protein